MLRCASPISAKAMPASAVSQIGDLQGCIRASSPSSTSSLRTAAQAVAACGWSAG